MYVNGNIIILLFVLKLYFFPQLLNKIDVAYLVEMIVI